MARQGDGRGEELANLSPEATSEKRVGAVLFYCALALLGYFVYLIFAPFLAPMAWAGILVVFFLHVAQAIGKAHRAELGGARQAPSPSRLILVVPLILVGIAFVKQAIEMATALQQRVADGQFAWANHAWQSIQSRIPGESAEDLNAMLHQYSGENGGIPGVGNRSRVAARGAIFLLAGGDDPGDVLFFPRWRRSHGPHSPHAAV